MAGGGCQRGRPAVPSLQAARFEATHQGAHRPSHRLLGLLHLPRPGARRYRATSNR